VNRRSFRLNRIPPDRAARNSRTLYGRRTAVRPAGCITVRKQTIENDRENDKREGLSVLFVIRLYYGSATAKSFIGSGLM
jgi:hypothetical protein